MAIKFHKDPEPPALANIHLWFDAQDIGTLWQESGRSTPVTASGDPVGAVDNKGFDALVALTQPTAGQRLTYHTSKAPDTGGVGAMLVSNCAATAPHHVFENPIIGEGELATEQTVCLVVEVDSASAAGRGWYSWDLPRNDAALDIVPPSSAFALNGGTVRSSALFPVSTLGAFYQRSNGSTIVAAKFSWDSGNGEVTHLQIPRVQANLVASAAPASFMQLRSPTQSFYIWWQASNGSGGVSTDPAAGSGIAIPVTGIAVNALNHQVASNTVIALNGSLDFLSDFSLDVNGPELTIRSTSGSVILFSSSVAAASTSASVEISRTAANGEIAPASFGAAGTMPRDDTSLFWGARNNSTGIDGAVGELLIWNKALDVAETAALETYITKKWGITWTTNILPQPENIVHRFDFSDTSTLWRDTAGTLPVTASGDAILRVDNKGFDGTALLQSNGSSLAPIWTDDVGAINGLGVGDFNAGTVRVSAIIADSQGADLGDYTCLFVAVTDGFSGADIGFGWGSQFSELGTRYFTGTAFHALVNGAQFSACAASIPASGVVYAVMMDNDGNDNQEVRYSFDTGASTGTASSGGPQDGTNFVVGADPTGANGHDGRIGELIVWTPALTSAERDALEVYVTDRWGIAWS